MQEPLAWKTSTTFPIPKPSIYQCSTTSEWALLTIIFSKCLASRILISKSRKFKCAMTSAANILGDSMWKLRQKHLQVVRIQNPNIHVIQSIPLNMIEWRRAIVDKLEKVREINPPLRYQIRQGKSDFGIFTKNSNLLSTTTSGKCLLV